MPKQRTQSHGQKKTKKKYIDYLMICKYYHLYILLIFQLSIYQKKYEIYSYSLFLFLLSWLDVYSDKDKFQEQIKGISLQISNKLKIKLKKIVQIIYSYSPYQPNPFPKTTPTQQVQRKTLQESCVPSKMNNQQRQYNDQILQVTYQQLQQENNEKEKTSNIIKSFQKEEQQIKQKFTQIQFKIRETKPLSIRYKEIVEKTSKITYQSYNMSFLAQKNYEYEQYLEADKNLQEYQTNRKKLKDQCEKELQAIKERIIQLTKQIEDQLRSNLLSKEKEAQIYYHQETQKMQQPKFNQQVQSFQQQSSFQQTKQEINQLFKNQNILQKSEYSASFNQANRIPQQSKQFTFSSNKQPKQEIKIYQKVEPQKIQQSKDNTQMFKSFQGSNFYQIKEGVQQQICNENFPKKQTGQIIQIVENKQTVQNKQTGQNRLTSSSIQTTQNTQRNQNALQPQQKPILQQGITSMQPARVLNPSQKNNQDQSSFSPQFTQNNTTQWNQKELTQLSKSQNNQNKQEIGQILNNQPNVEINQLIVKTKKEETLHQSFIQPKKETYYQRSFVSANVSTNNYIKKSELQDNDKPYQQEKNLTPFQNRFQIKSAQYPYSSPESRLLESFKVGLPNNKLICYFNSSLQAMRQVYFQDRDFFKNSLFGNYLYQLFKKMEDQQIVDSEMIQKIFRVSNEYEEHLPTGGDSYLSLHGMLSRLKSEMKIDPKKNKLFDELFTTKLEHQLYCSECGKALENSDSIFAYQSEEHFSFEHQQLNQIFPLVSFMLSEEVIQCPFPQCGKRNIPSSRILYLSAPKFVFVKVSPPKNNFSRYFQQPQQQISLYVEGESEKYYNVIGFCNFYSVHYTYTGKYKNQWIEFNDTHIKILDYPNTQNAIYYLLQRVD